jgi:hypothetical protein
VIALVIIMRAAQALIMKDQPAAVTIQSPVPSGRPPAAHPRSRKMAAAGKIRAVVDRRVTLEELPATLEALHRGEIVGRAVVVFP